MHKEIEKIIREDKYYLDFLEKFDRNKTKTFSKKKLKANHDRK